MAKEARILPIVILMVFLSGCASICEYTKVLLGTSTRELELTRKDAITKEFNIPYEVTFLKVQDILKQKGCKVFYKNRIKGVIVAMNFSGFINTSEAGIFLTSIEPSKTKIEITSQSQELTMAASKIIFPELEKLPAQK